MKKLCLLLTICGLLCLGNFLQAEPASQEMNHTPGVEISQTVIQNTSTTAVATKPSSGVTVIIWP